MNWKEVVELTKKNLAPDKRVEKTDGEWREILPHETYLVARNKGTERPFSGEYCEAHDPGLYACVCCETPLFDSRQKFESGTGWPSFTEPVQKNVIKYEGDKGFGMLRVEVMCNVCDCHLGHVFSDGPPPTGLRYCINSVSLKKIDEEIRED